MKRIPRVLIVTLLPLWIGGCDRNEVTSSETVRTGQPPKAPMSAPVSLPEGVMDSRLQGGSLEDENAKFDAWCAKNGLDSKNPAMLDADTDGDGFTNREEYIAATNPRDPNSVPGMLDGVVMKELKDVRVPVILRGVKEGKAQIERLDVPRTEEWEQGTVVNGLPYRVTAVKKEVKADKHGVFSDVSQVSLENTDTKESVVLIRDLPARSSETHAILTVRNGVELKVRVDEVIELPGEKDRQFRVLELRPDQVVIEEVGTRRPLTIPKR
jgi:hypothetical protein